MLVRFVFILADDVAIINQDLRSIVKSNSWLTSNSLLLGCVYYRAVAIEYFSNRVFYRIFCVKKPQVNMYYQRMWADQWRRFYSCTTACHSTAALLQTATSIPTLHRPFLSARYLSGLCFSGEHEQNDRAERHTAQWWRLKRGHLNTSGWCGAA